MSNPTLTLPKPASLEPGDSIMIMNDCAGPLTIIAPGSSTVTFGPGDEMRFEARKGFFRHKWKLTEHVVVG